MNRPRRQPRRQPPPPPLLHGLAYPAGADSAAPALLFLLEDGLYGWCPKRGRFRTTLAQAAPGTKVLIGVEPERI